MDVQRSNKEIAKMEYGSGWALTISYEVETKWGDANKELGLD